MSRHIAPLRDRRIVRSQQPQASKNQITVPNSCSDGRPPLPNPLPSPQTPRPFAVGAAAEHPRQTRRSQYLGESAKTPETAATSLELPVPATTLWAAALQQSPSAAAIPTHRAIQRFPRNIQHILAPSPLAQASVRNPLTLQKERTRKLQVHMGLAASTTARLSLITGALARTPASIRCVERTPARAPTQSPPALESIPPPLP